MRFSTDHYFQIGHAHYTAGKPCQDHALSRSSGLIACAIVSDGCSTGGNTDAGARILTFGTLQAIRDHARASDGSLGTAAISITSRQQQLIGAVRPMLGLDRSDMFATCMYAYLTQQGAIIHVQGDGVVGIKFRNGSIETHRFDWAKNAPFYPSYDEEDAKEIYPQSQPSQRERRDGVDVACLANQKSGRHARKRDHSPVSLQRRTGRNRSEAIQGRADGSRIRCGFLRTALRRSERCPMATIHGIGVRPL